MSSDPDLQRRNRRAVVWTIGSVAALYGIALLVVLGLLGLANRYPPADPTSLTAAANRTDAAGQRHQDSLTVPEAGDAALPDWVQRRRHQDQLAPWRVDAQGHVVWARP